MKKLILFSRISDKIESFSETELSDSLSSNEWTVWRENSETIPYSQEERQGVLLKVYPGRILFPDGVTDLVFNENEPEIDLEVRNKILSGFQKLLSIIDEEEFDEHTVVAIHPGGGLRKFRSTILFWLNHRLFEDENIVSLVKSKFSLPPHSNKKGPILCGYSLNGSQQRNIPYWKGNPLDLYSTIHPNGDPYKERVLMLLHACLNYETLTKIELIQGHITIKYGNHSFEGELFDEETDGYQPDPIWKEQFNAVQNSAANGPQDQSFIDSLSALRNTLLAPY